MAWNGVGTFNPPGTPEFPAIAGDVIRASYFNTVITSVCAGFSNTVPRDGQAALLGDINGGGLYTVKNLPPAVLPGTAVRYDEFKVLSDTVASLGAGVEPLILQGFNIL